VDRKTIYSVLLRHLTNYSYSGLVQRLSLNEQGRRRKELRMY